MQTSVTCRRIKTQHQGFTLLELLAVLALVALATGIALPRLTAYVDSVGAAFERETVIEAVSSLGLVARQQGHTIIFSGSFEHLPGDIPDNWHASVEQPIRFFPSGACEGGLVTLQGRERRFVYQLSAPRCRATLID